MLSPEHRLRFLACVKRSFKDSGVPSLKFGRTNLTRARNTIFDALLHLPHFSQSGGQDSEEDALLLQTFC